MFYNAFPGDLAKNLIKVIETIPQNTFNNAPVATNDNMIEYIIGNHVVAIPYRMYLLDISQRFPEQLKYFYGPDFVRLKEKIADNKSSYNLKG